MNRKYLASLALAAFLVLTIGIIVRDRLATGWHVRLHYLRRYGAIAALAG